MRLSAAALALGAFTKWNAGRLTNAGRNRLLFLPNDTLASLDLLANVSSGYDLLTVDEVSNKNLSLGLVSQFRYFIVRSPYASDRGAVRACQKVLRSIRNVDTSHVSRRILLRRTRSTAFRIRFENVLCPFSALYANETL